MDFFLVSRAQAAETGNVVRRNYLIDKLVRLRGALTGESKQALIRWANSLEQELLPAECAILVDAVRDPVPALAGMSVVAHGLRQRILPARPRTGPCAPHSSAWCG